MAENNLHIFKKYTDVPQTHRGFLFQYALTLEAWLTSYFNESNNVIYCEVDEDMKEVDFLRNRTCYKQIKCYTDSLSLNDNEIKKTLYNFFQIYINSETASFQFISSSKPAPRDNLLKNWIKNNGALPKDVMDECHKYVLSTISVILKDDYEKKISKVNEKLNNENEEKYSRLMTEKMELDDAYSSLELLINQVEVRQSFINQITWTFMNVDPEESVAQVLTKNRELLKTIGKGKYPELLLSRLLSEVIIKSANPEPDKRGLDNNLFDSILEESAFDLAKHIDPHIKLLIQDVADGLISIKSEINVIENKLHQHLDQHGIKNIYEEFLWYREVKLKEFYAPIFNEDFSVFELFVLPDYRSYQFKGEFSNPADKGLTVKSKKSFQDVNITDFFLNAAVVEGKKKPVFVHGDPGVGKSTFSKYLFMTMVTSSPEIITIHIDLKRLRFSKDFKQSIKQEMEEVLPSFKLVHLNISKFQFILDGFDELHLISDGHMDDFLISLKEFNKIYPEINIVLTGRTIAFEHYLKHIPTGSTIVEIKHFSTSKIIEWVEKWAILKNYPKPLSYEIMHISTSGRQSEEDEDEDEEPDNYNYDNEDHLVSLPLFLYLICTMLYEDENANVNDLILLEKWQLYKKLIDWTCATSKFEDDFNPFQKQMSLQDLASYKRLFNKNISLSMYHSNKFYITNQDILNRQLLPKDLNANMGNTKDLISSFIVLNYMKSDFNEVRNDYAFEFIHKSFYEYLVSESLIDILIIISQANKNIDNLAEYYYNAFSGFKLPEEVFDSFLSPMIETLNKEQLAMLYQRLDFLYNDYVLNHKFLVENNTSFLHDYLTRYPENANNKISMETNVLFSLLKIMPILAGLLDKNFKVNPSDLANQFRKVVQFSNDVFNAKELQLSFVDLKESEIVNVNLSGIGLLESELDNSRIKFTDLSFANINYSNLSKVIIQYSDLEGTELNYSIMKFAQISETNMTDASLIESDLSDSKIYNSNFTNVALDRSNLIGLEIIQCNFSGAVLDESDIRKSTMSYVDLSEASLRNCVLNNTNLSKSFLSYSSLYGSEVKNSNLKSSDLRFADLRDVDLSNADLTNADLSNANLSGAILVNTNLTGANLTKTKLIGTNLKNSNLSECVFHYSVIENVDLSYAIMDFADLTTSELIGCTLNNTSLRHTAISGQDFTTMSTLQGVDLSFSKISFSNFNGLDLNRSKLSNIVVTSCLFENVDFSNSMIVSSQFKECEMALSKFNRSEITNTRFKNCSLFDSDFDNAALKNVRFNKSNLVCSNIYNRNRDNTFINVTLPNISKRFLYNYST